jgi:hypothetical protein
MRSFILSCCSCFLLCAQLSIAQNSNSSNRQADLRLPHVIIAGLEAYKDTGPEQAVREWIKGSPIDGSKDALSEANELRQIQETYGAYQGFEVVSTRDLSPRIRILYLILDYEKGPYFARFMVYRSEQGWILTSFDFDTKEDLVFQPLPN